MSGETEESVSGWTIDTLHVHVVALIAEKDSAIRHEIELLRQMADSYHQSEAKAVDVAYAAHQEALHAAFRSTDKALTSALEAAQRALDQRATTLDKEFHEHLEQVRHETAIAFESSDRAIGKAEAANEKRFESVNEFRGQLADQAARLLTRTEYDANHQALIAKVDDEVGRNVERFSEINRRLDLTQGSRTGATSLFTFIGMLVALILAITGIVAFFNSRV